MDELAAVVRRTFLRGISKKASVRFCRIWSSSGIAVRHLMRFPGAIFLLSSLDM